MESGVFVVLRVLVSTYADIAGSGTHQILTPLFNQSGRTATVTVAINRLAFKLWQKRRTGGFFLF
jgi:hypothetical protein